MSTEFTRDDLGQRLQRVGLGEFSDVVWHHLRGSRFPALPPVPPPVPLTPVQPPVLDAPAAVHPKWAAQFVPEMGERTRSRGPQSVEPWQMPDDEWPLMGCVRASWLVIYNVSGICCRAPRERA